MELMKQRNLLEGFSEEEIADFRRRVRRISMPRGRIIFDQGESGRDIFWIESGWVKTFYTSLSGSVITIGMWSSGDVIGAPDIDFEERLLSAQVVRDASLLLLSSSDINYLLKTNERFVHNLVAALSFKVRWATSIFDRMATESVLARVAQTIMALAHLYGEEAPDGTISVVQLSHQDIADMVGASRPSVSLTLRKLEEGGFIKLAMKRITIVDREGLQGRRYE